MIAVNVAQLLKLPVGTTRDFEFSEPPGELNEDVQLVAPIQGQARLMRTSRGILASARYQTAVQQECGRCLSPTVAEIEGTLEDEFTPRVDVLTGHPSAEPPESEELAIDEHHVLSLSEVIRQDILTRLPLQPLCEPDCPGLCPGCGRDLRSGRCECALEAAASSPFADLAERLSVTKDK
jgi:uncharacterized protein